MRAGLRTPLAAPAAETRLTIAQLLPALDGGGVERGTLEVAAALAARGHRSIVVSGGGRLVEALVAAGSEHVALPIGRKSPAVLLQPPRLRRLLHDEAVDVVHARSRLPAWIGYLAWRGMPAATRPRFVTTVHGRYSVSRYSEVMVRGERVIAVSDSIRDYVLREYPRVDPARVEVIHRGVDDGAFPYGHRPDDRWLEAWRSAYPALAGRFVVTLPGRLTRLKGHREFLDVIDLLVRRGVPAHGLVVGEAAADGDSYAARIRREVDRRRLPVSFIGHRDDMRDVYAVSDAVLSLSRQPESFGRTVLEALRVGTPVVGFGHGGVGEILDAMFPRGKVPAGDVAAAAERLAEFHADPPRPPRANAFPLRAMLDRTLSLYTDLARCPSG